MMGYGEIKLDTYIEKCPPIAEHYPALSTREIESGSCQCMKSMLQGSGMVEMEHGGKRHRPRHEPTRDAWSSMYRS